LPKNLRDQPGQPAMAMPTAVENNVAKEMATKDSRILPAR
jgi:hypothetical protein